MEFADPTGTMRIGGPRLRTLLGLLGLRAPAVVSREALIDGIWDANPPTAAALTLRTYVAHLRRRLTASSLDGLITTRASGYALNVPPEWVDVRRFEERVRLAGTALAAEAIPQAVAHLKAGLRLWRGDVLADCTTGAWARAEATRLRELWHFATEDLLTAQLKLGDYAAVTSELESLVARHPLRERLWELLMLALSQAGRRGEALNAYRRARARLVDELGVEPGPGLRRLEATILADDSRQQQKPAASATRRAQPALPSPLTRLVGRHAELAEVRAQLTQHRLVTLTGVGGCGKTRMAIAVARELAPGFAHGAWFIDLAPVTEHAQVQAVVAAALGISEGPYLGPLEALTENLRSWQCLLVLDNCEHLLDACAALTATLLSSCPALRVLTTSREALGLPGEVTFPVPLLAVPPLGEGGAVPMRLDEVKRYDAVCLLLERSTAQTVRYLTDADAPALAAVCAAVDGLPLALELVATRTEVLTVKEIAARLNEPSLLRVRRYAEHPHHRVLDASIEWSHDLLDMPTQARFRQLAVFAGGFSLAAAEAVWHPQPGERPAVDALSDLVAKSLVVVERQPTGTRYRLLETIRRWAWDRLAECPPERTAARERHAAHVLHEAEQADQGLCGPSMADGLERLAADHDNVRTAMAWYAETPNPLPQLRLAVALARYCQLRGQYRQGQLWIRQALARQHELPAAETVTVGAAWASDAMFSFLVSNYGEAQASAERALEIHRRHDDHAGACRALRLLGSVARERGEYEASLACLQQAAALPCDDFAAAGVLMLSGFTAWLAGDLDQAEQLLDKAYRRYQSSGDSECLASAQIHLAAVAYYRGRNEQARELVDDALTTFSKLEVKEGISWALDLLGLVELRQGKVSSAIGTLRASLDLHLALGDRWRQSSLLDALAQAFVARGEVSRAAELLALAAALRETIGTVVPAIELPAWQATWDAVQERLSEQDLRTARIRGGTATVAGMLAKIS
ncbi:BTAD domain-containing putative transcriptional regulator [Rhizocola hellebori]|uniref:BTAD domain-containing putative transcriptional regulator n=1 Tax=Rhizocola hellebori TaxID=1392758 RepID=UPI001941E496|nr:BTAD domain-containing putative transcriptional regulator [Rhizocola hellebori]